MVTSPRWRPASLAPAAVLAAVLLTACGPAAVTQAPSHPPAPVTVSGPLVRVRQNTLFVERKGGRGAVRVTFSAMATPIYAVTAANSEDIQPGSCVAATGDRDATGTLIAGIIVVASSIDDTCPSDSVPAPPARGDPSPSPVPSPGSFPMPSPEPGPTILRGQVMGLGGGAIVVQEAQGEPVVVLLPHDVRVWFFEPSGHAALVIPSCVVVQGVQRARSVAARRIVDWPSGSDC